MNIVHIEIDLTDRLKRKDAGFNRKKEVRIFYSTCDMCGKDSNGVSTDNSEGEYCHVFLCFNCLRNLEQEFER